MLAALERGEKKKQEEEAKQDEEDDGDDEGCTDKILNVLSIPYTYLFKFTGTQTNASARYMHPPPSAAPPPPTRR